MADPPQKRYRTTFVIDHHDADHLNEILHRLSINHVVDWFRSDGRPPYHKSTDGEVSTTIEEAADYVTKDQYPEALDAWWKAERAERQARHNADT